MVLKSSFTILVAATLAVFSANTPQAEAHSWAECVDWRFTGKKNDWSDKGGKCMGYARRFPLGHGFGTLDEASPNRHYMQYKSHPDTSPPCSNLKDGSERGSDETRASPPSKAYGGKFGRMTVTTVGSTLCVRWPSKTHAGEYKVPNVQIYLSKNSNGKDISQKELFKYKVADLPFSNCNKGGNKDKRPCGGCFKVPTRASGIYLLQWRWMLNKNEWYTSCAEGVDSFKSWLVKIPTMKTGLIVLQHDVLPAEVNVAVNGILPIAYATKSLTMEPIAQCLNDGKPYKEGAGTFKLFPAPYFWRNQWYRWCHRSHG
ncbi:hypothetical protein BGZ75_000545 [Mortierella antarctica]|nr:hypothetical protein BGZ75_000545 [Mortierella antarctica]